MFCYIVFIQPNNSIPIVAGVFTDLSAAVEAVRLRYGYSITAKHGSYSYMNDHLAIVIETRPFGRLIPY